MALTTEQQKALDDSYKVTAEAERVLAESLAESAANDSNLGDEGDDPENLVIDAGGSTEARDYYEGTDKEYTEADAQAERDAQRARMQNQIDTITNNYSDYVANIKQKGEEDATRTSLISGASGLLGSPRATTQIDRTKQLTQDQVDALNAQRDLKIQAVKDKGDAIAELKIEAERTKATGNTEAYLTYLDKVQTDSRANWAALAQAGVYSIEDIKLASTEGGQSGDYYKQMLEDTGWNELMLDSMFNASLPKAEQVDYNYTWKGNNLVVTSVGSDGTLSVDTYTADDLGIPTGTNVKFITDVPSGEMFWYDEDNPLDENGNLKTTKLEGISAGVEETGDPTTDAGTLSYETIISNVDTLLEAGMHPGEDGDTVAGKVTGKDWRTGLSPLAWINMPEDESEYIAGVEQIMASGTLETLIEAKARGATFGALSDKEMDILAASFSKIGTWTITDDKGHVLGYKPSKEAFEKELNNIKTLMIKSGGASPDSTTGTTAGTEEITQEEWDAMTPEEQAQFDIIEE